MNEINKMIVFIYQSKQKQMKHSEGKARLFIAKLTFGLLIWIWLLPVLIILEKKLHWIKITDKLPNSRVGYLPIALVMYFILNYFTWRLKEVDAYLLDPENEESIKKSKRLFIILSISGLAFALATALYNQGNVALSD